MKQTAVEWLVEKLSYSTSDGTIISHHKIINKLVEQAKQMEKEQIVTTWNTAHQAGRFEGKGIAEDNWQTFETYWEETFKSQLA